jgi:hypothetical protein
MTGYDAVQRIRTRPSDDRRQKFLAQLLVANEQPQLAIARDRWFPQALSCFRTRLKHSTANHPQLLFH